jgi:cytochrome c556
MSSTLHPPKIDQKDIPTLAPEVVVTRGDQVAAKPEPDGKTAASAAPKNTDAAAGTKAPAVDATFRATSTDPVTGRARKSFGRRLLRGVIGMILTACVAGAAMLWQSHGDVVRQIVAKSVAPIVVALLSRDESPAVEQPPGSAAVQASVVAGGSAPSTSQSATDNTGSTGASAAPEATQLLQSLARELSSLRQDLEQMKAAIAELKSSDDLMAREIAKVSDKATDKALEQALRPRVSMISPPPAQPVAMPARKPPPQVARPVQPRPVSAAPQVAYVPRPSESRAAPPPQSAAAPPMNLSAPPRPPGSLREQMP